MELVMQREPTVQAAALTEMWLTNERGVESSWASKHAHFLLDTYDSAVRRWV